MNLYELSNLEYVDRVEVSAKVYMKDGTLFETDVPINAMMESSSFDRNTKFYQDMMQYKRSHIHKLLTELYYDENVLVLDNNTTDVASLPGMILDYEEYESEVLDFVFYNIFRIGSVEALMKFKKLLIALTDIDDGFQSATTDDNITTIHKNLDTNGICLLYIDRLANGYQYVIADRYDYYQKLKERCDKMLQESEKG